MKKSIFCTGIFLSCSFSKAGIVGSPVDSKILQKAYRCEKNFIVYETYEGTRRGHQSVSSSRSPLGHTKMAIVMQLINQQGLVRSSHSLDTSNSIRALNALNKQKRNKKFHGQLKAFSSKSIRRSPSSKSLLSLALQGAHQNVNKSEPLEIPAPGWQAPKDESSPRGQRNV